VLCSPVVKCAMVSALALGSRTGFFKKDLLYPVPLAVDHLLEQLLTSPGSPL
jgi:hypothetical protein